MSQPKLPPDLRDRLSQLGYNVMCYQPVTMFKKDPPRKLPNVPRQDDPWHVVMRRNDRAPWADGSPVAQARADNLRDAILACLDHVGSFGLLPKMSALGKALDGLTAAVHAAH